MLFQVQHLKKNSSVAIGYSAGYSTQGTNAVAIGVQAGQNTQGNNTLAAGYNAGQNQQSPGAIAIGYLAGQNGQGENAIAIGNSAGQLSQGRRAIAIGYLAGNNYQGNNSIVINASENTIGVSSNSCYIAPVNTHAPSSSLSMLLYDNTTKEVIRSTSATSAQNKTFIIDHPTYQNKYLVHACLEGPESGVYYRGQGEIINNKSVVITLPNYVTHLATDFTIQTTLIYSGKKVDQIYTSEVENNRFTVYGENCKFFWIVQGKRNDIEVEPIKSSVNVKGYGPYKWI